MRTMRGLFVLLLLLVGAVAATRDCSTNQQSELIHRVNDCLLTSDDPVYRENLERLLDCLKEIDIENCTL